jgi:hypothetical protein
MRPTRSVRSRGSQQQVEYLAGLWAADAEKRVLHVATGFPKGGDLRGGEGRFKGHEGIVIDQLSPILRRKGGQQGFDISTDMEQLPLSLFVAEDVGEPT